MGGDDIDQPAAPRPDPGTAPSADVPAAGPEVQAAPGVHAVPPAAPPAAPPATGAPTGAPSPDVLLAADDATAALGALVAMNNTWGRGALIEGRDYRQSVAHGPEGIRMNWSWPEGDGRVLGFPELIVGRKPWGGPTGGDLLPLRLDAAEGLTARWRADWGGETGKFNLAFDLWISDAPQVGPDTVRAEVMVWIKTADFPSSGVSPGELALDGLSGPLFVNPGHGNNPGESWTYLAWLPASGEGIRSGSLDLGALLARLVADGRLEGDHWLTSVEFGPEITGGAGWVAVTEFAVARPGAQAAPPGQAQILHPPPAPAHP